MKHIVHYVPHTHYDAEVFLTRAETFEIGFSVLLGALAAMREDPRFKFGGPREYWWQGLDGTRLFCHWMRDSYCVLFPAPANLHEFKKFAATRLRHLKEHARTPHLLAVSGADLAHVQPHVSRVFAEYN